MYNAFIRILEDANEVISYTTTRWKDLSNCTIDDKKTCNDCGLMIVRGWNQFINGVFMISSYV